MRTRGKHRNAGQREGESGFAGKGSIDQASAADWPGPAGCLDRGAARRRFVDVCRCGWGEIRGDATCKNQTGSFDPKPGLARMTTTAAR